MQRMERKGRGRRGEIEDTAERKNEGIENERKIELCKEGERSGKKRRRKGRGKRGG